MDNKRKHTRTPFQATVKMWFDGKVFAVKTSDVSYGGVFLMLDDGQTPPVGSEVMVQMQGMAEAAPIQRMRVVRMHANGIGLEFTDADSDGARPADTDTPRAAHG